LGAATCCGWRVLCSRSGQLVEHEPVTASAAKRSSAGRGAGDCLVAIALARFGAVEEPEALVGSTSAPCIADAI
jgi:hypothetical protein